MVKEQGILRPEIKELVEKLFFEFNKDPQKNKGQANYFYEHLETCLVDPLKRAIESIAVTEHSLPNLRKLLSQYRSECPIKDTITNNDCKRCGGDGLIVTIFTGGREHDGIQLDGVSTSIDGETEEIILPTYYTVINGRCGCVAGEEYLLSFPNIAIHPHFIKKEGDKKDWYNYNWCASQLCTQYNNKNKETLPWR
jgi:hypothetical protein